MSHIQVDGEKEVLAHGTSLADDEGNGEDSAGVKEMGASKHLSSGLGTIKDLSSEVARPSRGEAPMAAGSEEAQLQRRPLFSDFSRSPDPKGASLTAGLTSPSALVNEAPSSSNGRESHLASGPIAAAFAERFPSFGAGLIDRLMLIEDKVRVSL